MGRRRMQPPGDGGQTQDEEPTVIIEDEDGADTSLVHVRCPLAISFGDGARFYEAVRRLEEILAIRDQRSHALALIKNVARKPPTAKDILKGSAAGIVTAILLPWYLLPFVLPFIAVGAIYYRTVRETSRIRETPSDREPPVPEFKHLWANMVYRYVKAVEGFNARVAMLDAVRQDCLSRTGDPEAALKLQAADDMARLLQGVEQALYEAGKILGRFQTKAKDILYPLNEVEEDRLRELDPLGLEDGHYPFAWLEIDGDDLLPSRILEQLHRDIGRIESDAAAHFWERDFEGELERRRQERQRKKDE